MLEHIILKRLYGISWVSESHSAIIIRLQSLGLKKKKNWSETIGDMKRCCA